MAAYETGEIYASNTYKHLVSSKFNLTAKSILTLPSLFFC